MARNGSGTYSRPVSDYVFDTVISETDVNLEMNQIATALTDSIAKDGQTTPSANLPMGGFKHTGVATAAARDQYAVVSQAQDGAYVWCGTAGGTANAITLSPSPAVSALATGMEFRWQAGASTNTGAVTITVSGLASVAAEISDQALSGGEHTANKYFRGLYDGTAFQIEQLSGFSLHGENYRAALGLI